MSSQRLYDVIRVASFFLSSQCPDTGIQEKEWCHASNLLLLSSQCVTLGSSKLCLQISLIRVAFYAKTQLELHAK
ncbi:hypothetical protein [Wolbachia endosymbiont (group A) of Tiphia femorata]|uniref:hypothetical protein n=1 Tax=Wolbachia endosymbiont (group A) of Tiphia femorata TaxID=2954063 RepID=UPI002231097F|nr:hypothetical protein [Wolbachia endosymbiont (group A) of Tiphia femorata]